MDAAGRECSPIRLKQDPQNMSPVEASQGKPREGKAVLGPQRGVRQALELIREACRYVVPASSVKLLLSDVFNSLKQ